MLGRLALCVLFFISASDAADDQETLQESVNKLEQNVTDLRDTFAEFRQSVSRHLHKLHQYQINNQAVIQSLKNRRQGSKGLKGNQTNDGESFFIPRSFRGPPKVRHPKDYDFAICVLSANSALAPEKKENIRGVVKLFQKKDDNTLHVYVRIKGFNVLFRGSLDSNSSQDNQMASLHVHEKADFSNGCESLGELYYANENSTEKGSRSHVGDFGDLVVDEDGAVHLMFMDSVASLHGKNSILGKSLIVHSPDEDLAQHTEDVNSLGSKDNDKRVGCCVIEKTQYQ